MTTWYDHPQYFEMVFRDETPTEIEFFEQCFDRYVDGPVETLFDPGCGGGRLVVGMAAKGYQSTGLDLSDAMVRYANAALRRRKLGGKLNDDGSPPPRGSVVVRGDMSDFELPRTFDAVHCTFNTFRHLMKQTQVDGHFASVARHLRPGGIYILGYHLIPPDAEEAEIERYTATHGGTRVSCTLRVTDFDRRTRTENIRINVKATLKSGKIKRIVSEFPLRLYNARQTKSWIKRHDDKFELVAVHDFGYDIDETREIDDDLADAIFILRRRG